jgi:single-strand DNA-binding protein
MAFSVNKHFLLGRVGREPEIKKTSGKSTLVVTFSLATTERYPSQSGNMVENTDWHNIVAFSRQAEIVRDFVKKGSKLYIEGKVRTRSWDDKDTGKKMHRTETIANSIGLLDGKPAGEGSGSHNTNGHLASSENLDADPAEDSSFIQDSEIPF